MPRARFVVVALSAAVAVVVASVLWLRPTGAEAGSEDDGEDDREAVIGLDSAEFPETGDTMAAVREDLPDGRWVRAAEHESERRAKRPAPTLPARERGEVGEHLDPDALYPVSFSSGGGVVDVGEFEDPESDAPTAPPRGGASDVGDYLDPEEGP